MLFWAPFLVIFSGVCSDFQDLVKVFRDFAQISMDFALILTKSKHLGCACTPRSPASNTSGAAYNRSAMIYIKKE